MRKAPFITLTEEAERQLKQFARGRSTPARLVERAQIVLKAWEGKTNEAIAEELGVNRRTVGRWRSRFSESGIAGIEKDAPRPGRLPKVSDSIQKQVVDKTLNEKPKGATQWSTRRMAAEFNVSDATIRRIWKLHGLKPHLVQPFKLSNDPKFVEKPEDVIGLYLSPPEHALVFCVDEKSQVQALDRTQPRLPMKRGKAGTMTHDYRRHGTTTLFAALNTLDGSIISTCQQQHRHQEWLKFLKLIDRNTPKDKEIHLIADNYATHKHPEVQKWLAKKKRFYMHFTPTSASWLNMVERFFRDLSVNRLKRGVFKSLPQLISAIDEYVAIHNENPKPFIWTAKATDILAKVSSARASLHKVTSV